MIDIVAQYLFQALRDIDGRQDLSALKEPKWCRHVANYFHQHCDALPHADTERDYGTGERCDMWLGSSSGTSIFLESKGA